MAAEENVDSAFYGRPEEGMISSEQLALMDFAYRLGSCNFNTEPGIADEGETRQEAKLLMSLLASPPKSSESELEAVSSSESETSYVSDSSASRRDTFSFVCPSLSLENSSTTVKKALSHDDKHTTTPSPVVNDKAKHLLSPETPPPAVLLGRPLKVDDRDALRLSADAMARNVLQSIQKAVDWRLQAWIQSLSNVLIQKEQEMVQNGASENNLKTLLNTHEAHLIVVLREVAERIKVTGAGTSFRVLPQRIENEEAKEPAAKKQRTAGEPSQFEEEEYQYKVSHALVFECVVNLQTPAGFSEITLQLPGTMEGTFLSNHADFGELRSVNIQIDTDILAAMVEKSCRTIVRSSVESAMEQSTTETYKEQDATAATTSPADMTTPPTRKVSSGMTPEAVMAAIVTPRKLFTDLPTNSSNDHSPKSVLFPIPDDLDGGSSDPRRISPQPIKSPELSGNMPFTPRTPTKKNGTGPCLISPPPNEAQDYHEVGGNGPSLPMLVEVACRAMRAN